MYAIDEKSPLAGYDAERLEEGDARLFLSIEACDHAIGALVHDMRIYTAVEVLFGMHYVEAVTLDDQRRPVADLTRQLLRPHRNMRLLVAAGKRLRCCLPISSASFGSGACGCGGHAAPRTNSSSRRPRRICDGSRD
jgi:hypothetical protein